MPANETNDCPETPPPQPTGPAVEPTRQTIHWNFHRNHDPADLIRYHGQWVAWSLDGRKVLCASPDPYKLCEMIDAAGLKPEVYVTDGLDAPWR
jgi:hypothetical protein